MHSGPETVTAQGNRFGKHPHTAARLRDMPMSREQDATAKIVHEIEEQARLLLEEMPEGPSPERARALQIFMLTVQLRMQMSVYVRFVKNEPQ